MSDIAKQISSLRDDIAAVYGDLRESLDEVREDNARLRAEMAQRKRKPDYMAESRRIQDDMDEFVEMCDRTRSPKRIKNKSSSMRKMMMLMLLSDAL
jgi:hypothetical protein